MIPNDNAINYSKRISALSVLCLTLVLFACKDDDSGSVKCENGTFEMTLNGGKVTGASFNNTLLNGSSVGVTGKRVDIRATDNVGRQVIITISDNSSAGGNCISTDAYIPFDEIATGTENAFFFTIIEDDVSSSFIDGEFDISSCDADARQISGTFSFSFGDTEVTNGSFTDMCYTII